MSRERILVVDDEEDILELVAFNLKREGYHVETIATGEQVLSIARSWQPELILLDLMLPGISGLDVCQTLKREEDTRAIPIVMLTAKSEEADIVTGLELGADDYVTKPFSPRELLARVRAVLRRKTVAVGTLSSSAAHRIEIHNLVIDPARHQASIDEEQLDLTLTEFQMLSWLAQHPGRVFTRQQIIEGVRGDDYPVTDRSVDVQVVALRRKLGDHGELIQTVRGVGYRFKE